MEVQDINDKAFLERLRKENPAAYEKLMKDREGIDPSNFGRPAQLDSYSLRGACGSGRDLAMDSLQQLLQGTPDTITVHRYQADDLGFGAKHGFAVVVFPGNEGKPGQVFIVDPTIAQFTDPDHPDWSGDNMNAQKGKTKATGLQVVRDILRDGYTPVTFETAQQYLIALGANEQQAAAAAAMILSGQSALLTDLVTAQGVQRSTGAAEADIPWLDLDVYGPPTSPDKPWSVVEDINEVLMSGNPPYGSPRWKELAKLRDRLVDVGDRVLQGSARKQPITSTKK
jgi:hypothetical protein